MGEGFGWGAPESFRDGRAGQAPQLLSVWHFVTFLKFSFRRVKLQAKRNCCDSWGFYKAFVEVAAQILSVWHFVTFSKI